MVEEKQQIDIYQLLAFLWRRKWLIIFLFIPIFALAEIYILRSPRVYRAEITLSIVPQKVPSAYVRSTVSGDLESLIHAIWQEITSRRNLEALIREYNLYPSLVDKLPMESVVERMRRAIHVSRPRGGRRNVFVISFEYTNPELCAKIVNRIANIFIEENMKLREEQAKTITAFLDEELRRIEGELRKREIMIQEYKMKHMNELPEQKQSIISTLDRLQKESEALQMRKQMLEDRKVSILEQLKMAKQMGTFLPSGSKNSGTGSIQDLGKLIQMYEDLKLKYTEKHPDVIRLKKMIEARKKELAKMSTNNDNKKEKSEVTNMSITEQFRAQLAEIDKEILHVTQAYKKVQSEMQMYQQRLENIPKCEQELKDMSRDYDNLMKTYRMLLDKKIQAAMAETLERRQQGEQFKIIDPAQVPQVPIKPNPKKILIMGFILALGTGLGMAFVLEFFLDRRIYDEVVLEKTTGIKVLATIPQVVLPVERRRALIKSGLFSLISMLGLSANIFLMYLVLKGYQM